MPYTYHIYGLILESELPLPELTQATGTADIRLWTGSLERPPARVEEPWFAWTVEGMTTRLAWEGVGTFLLRDGREIVVDPDPEVAAGRLRDFLLSYILGALLQQRGYLVMLHASAVLMHGQAVAFVGESGEGKSTMTAAFSARGFPVVSDELVPVDVSDGALRVWPAFSRLKLTAASALAVGCPSEALTQIHAAEDKFGWQVAPADPESALPLSRIYLLRSGDAHSVREATFVEAVGGIADQSFHKRLLAPERLRQHFLACADLARSGRVRVLTRRRCLAELDAVAQLVEADVRSLA